MRSFPAEKHSLAEVFRHVSAQKKHLAKLEAEFKPASVQMQSTCTMLADILAGLEIRESARLNIRGSFQARRNSLTYWSRHASARSNRQCCHLSNDELAERALALADRAVELMREAPAPSVDAPPASSPIVMRDPKPAPRDESPVGPAECIYCHQPFHAAST